MNYVFLGIVIVTLAGSIYSINLFQNSFAQENTPPQGIGQLGDEHEHASMLVKIFDEKLDFSQPFYQLQSPYIHFEGKSDHMIHRHASNVTLGYFFDSLGISTIDDCISYPGSKKFCQDKQNFLRFFINHIEVFSITDYVIKQGDRVLVSFGDSDDNEIIDQLVELDIQAFLADDLQYPKWLDNIFVWFAEDKISKEELFSAIQFLIDKKIISQMDSSQILIA